jgi:competence protein ComEC
MLFCFAAALVACAAPTPAPEDDGGVAAAADDGGPAAPGIPDGGSDADAGEEPPPADPDEVVLRMKQIALSPLALGEAALLWTPAGESVLIDVGNDSHADEVASAVIAEGFGAGVDWVVLTHFHADHIGAVDKLFGEDGALEVRQGIVWRGDVHTDDANAAELAELKTVVESVPDVALCDPSGCGELPWTISLGEATLTIFVADGEVATSDAVVRVGDGLDEENAHSLAGVVTAGDFDFVFGGDLTGGGKDTPDIESAVAARAAVIPWVPAGEVELIKLNHHGISSSTSPAWAAWLLGAGRTTNALVGATGAYLDAPSEEALDVVRPHLGAGRVWVNDTGLFGGSDPIMTELGDDVLIVVERDGDHSIGNLDGSVGQQF